MQVLKLLFVQTFASCLTWEIEIVKWAVAYNNTLNNTSA